MGFGATINFFSIKKKYPHSGTHTNYYSTKNYVKTHYWAMFKGLMNRFFPGDTSKATGASLTGILFQKLWRSDIRNCSLINILTRSRLRHTLCALRDSQGQFSSFDIVPERGCRLCRGVRDCASICGLLQIARRVVRLNCLNPRIELYCLLLVCFVSIRLCCGHRNPPPSFDSLDAELDTIWKPLIAALAPWLARAAGVFRRHFEAWQVLHLPHSP